MEKPVCGYQPSGLSDADWEAVPCVVVLSHPDGHDRFYGPFGGVLEAEDWCRQQVKEGFSGFFVIMPMRSPSVARSYPDWWTPDRHRTRIEIVKDFGLGDEDTPPAELTGV